MTRYHFRFRDVPGRGSPQKYWHYLWGYLLPTISFLIDKEASERHVPPPIFESYGPLMDGVLADYMSILALDYRMAAPHENLASSQYMERFVPRWDVLQFSMAWPYLRELPISPAPSRQERWRNGIQVLRQRKLDALTSGMKGRRLLRRIEALKRFILHALSENEPADSTGSPYLVIDRSSAPAAQHDPNCRFVQEYGTATKSLRGVARTVAKLKDLGFNVERFEPGAVGQIEQITRFSNARGVIAIRGSDLANILWLKPGSKLIVIRPQKKLSTHLYGMADLLRLDFHELGSNSPHPNLGEFPIERYLENPSL